MSQDPFKEFIDAQTKAAQDKTVDIAQELDTWKNKLDELYALATKALSPYIDSGSVAIRPGVKSMSEELAGSYEVETISIVIGLNTVQLDPVGTFLIGARGRVDVIGPRGRARLILVPKTSKGVRVIITVGNEPTPPQPEMPPVSEWGWKISSLPPKITYTDLDEESFRDLIMGVVGG